MSADTHRFGRGDLVQFEHDGETATGMVQICVEKDGAPAYAITRDDTNERVFVRDENCEALCDE